jgi:hypothetical protein
MFRRLVEMLEPIEPSNPSPEHDVNIQVEIIAKCDQINAGVIQKVNDRLQGPLDKSSSGGVRSTKLPMVLTLGNHSSGV